MKDHRPPPAPPEGNPDILMLRHDLEGLPDWPFPQGYRCRSMRSGDEAWWTEIWRQTQPPIEVNDDKFATEFGTDWRLIGERCFLLLDPEGSMAGTISAWLNPSFRGGEWGRIHWVALRPSHQGRGLAKPMLAFALRTLARWHRRAYLGTQVFRLRAVKIYLDAGFQPDLSDPAKQPLWRYLRDVLQHPGLSHVT